MSAYAAKRRIAEFSSNGEEFLRKYEDLKIRQSRNLDPLVYLLSKVTEDKRLCGFLQTVRPHIEGAGPQEITEVKVLDLVEGEEVELPEKGGCGLLYYSCLFNFSLNIGAVLTQEEIEQLMGKLETVTSILQEREKAKLNENKVCCLSPFLPPSISLSSSCFRRVATSPSCLTG